MQSMPASKAALSKANSNIFSSFIPLFSFPFFDLRVYIGFNIRHAVVTRYVYNVSVHIRIMQNPL